MKRRIVLMGAPGSGKGTQGEKLADAYHFEAVSTGAMLREEQKKGSALGGMVRELIEAGKLVPDEMMTALVADWAANRDVGRGFILDGFPRTVPQAEALDRILQERNEAIDAVLFFDVPFDVISDRILGRVGCSACGKIFKIGLQVASVDVPCPACGGKLVRRADDTLETLRQRMAEYELKTAPVLAYYEKQGLLTRIPADGEPDVVFSRVQAAITSGE